MSYGTPLVDRKPLLSVDKQPLKEEKTNDSQQLGVEEQQPVQEKKYDDSEDCEDDSEDCEDDSISDDSVQIESLDSFFHPLRVKS